MAPASGSLEPTINENFCFLLFVLVIYGWFFYFTHFFGFYLLNFGTYFAKKKKNTLSRIGNQFGGEEGKFVDIIPNEQAPWSFFNLLSSSYYN